MRARSATFVHFVAVVSGKRTDPAPALEHDGRVRNAAGANHASLAHERPSALFQDGRAAGRSQRLLRSAHLQRCKRGEITLRDAAQLLIAAAQRGDAKVELIGVRTQVSG
jgi:hypothetical protein